MRRYGRIQGLVLALGWADFYRDVARNWRGIGLLYVLLVIMLTWIPILAKWQSAAGRFVEELPELSIKKGIASSPAAQPFVILKDDLDRPIILLDTTGKTDFDKSEAKILLTDTKLFLRDKDQVQIHNLIDLPDIDITKELLGSWGRTTSTWLGILCFPFVVVLSLILWLIIMLLASALSMSANAKARLPFAAVLRLAAVGSTLGMYFGTAAMFFSINVPPLLLYLIYIAFTMAYAIFGIKCVESDPLEEFDDDHDPRDDHHDERPAERWSSSTSPPPDEPSDAFRSGPKGP